jgi:hypothetical protein
LISEVRATDAEFGRGLSMASEVLTSFRELDMWTDSSDYLAWPWIEDSGTVLAVNLSKRPSRKVYSRKWVRITVRRHRTGKD